MILGRFKKFLVLLLTVFLLISGTFFSTPVTAAGVTLSSGGDLNAAIRSAENGGTITINGTLMLPPDFVWGSHGKAVTITGGTLDASALSSFHIHSDVTFKNMTLKIRDQGTIYANGHNLTVEKDVTIPLTTNKCTLFGGGNGTTVASTNVTLLAGSYKEIYGGSNGGTVAGDTNLYVGGNVNSDVNQADHGAGIFIFGGGYSDKIGGSTHLTIADSTKATIVYGGSHKSGATIGKSSNLTVLGGYLMGIYGGSRGVNTRGDANTWILGGEIEQVFGGNEKAALTGNATTKLFGGTISRRVYGGCYNETSGLSFTSSHGVSGTSTLIIGSGTRITFSLVSESDRSIYAKSRHKSDVDGTAKLIFSDPAAYTTYKSKLKAQDLAMKIIMGNISVADSTHTLTHTASGSTLTEVCDTCTHTATATLAVNPSVNLVYNGSAILPVSVQYGATWLAETPSSISYASNVNAGQATATLSYPRESLTATLSFTVQKAPSSHNAPRLEAIGESVSGYADGAISGLSNAMEYSTDGQSYLPVTDPAMNFAPGNYLVRYAAENSNFLPSDSTAITVQEGINGKILTAKYQLLAAATAEDEVTSLRLIATVDSLEYASVGFRIWIENDIGELIEQEALTTTTVFTSVMGRNGDQVITYSPADDFCEDSAYFFTKELTNIPKSLYGQKIRVQAFLVTLTGRILYGNSGESTLNDLLPSAPLGGN